MPFFDLPLDELEHYRPRIERPSDFEEFWRLTLAAAAEHPIDVRSEPVDAGLRHVEVADVSFAGFAGQPVRAWYLRPAGVDDDLPVIVHYAGYGLGRGFPYRWLTWPAAGYAVVAMDSRAQGWAAGGGHSVTPDPGGSGPAAAGLLTRGLPDPHALYHRRLFTDAARALTAARALPGVAADRVAVAGGSQGGALALAAAALDGQQGGQVSAVLADVPWLSHIRRGVGIAPAGPFDEVRRYLAVYRDQVEPVFAALSYIDVANHIEAISAPLLASVALMDTICPPSTVYAAYNRYRGQDAEISVYQFNDHEGGSDAHVAEQLRWLRERLPVA